MSDQTKTVTKTPTEKQDKNEFEASFVSSSMFLKRILGYAAVSSTIKKSQQVYARAKESNKIVNYSFNTMESSVNKILASPIAKFVDTTLNKIDEKRAMDDKANKVLDMIDESLEKGKDVVEEKKEVIADLVQWSKNFYTTKVDKVTKTGKHYIEDAQTLYSKGKEQAIELYKKKADQETIERIAKYYKHKKEQIVHEVNLKKDTALYFYGKSKDLIGTTKDEIVHKGNEYYILGKQKALENRIVIRSMDLWDEKKEKAWDYLLVGKNMCLHQKEELMKKAKPYVDPYLEKAQPLFDILSRQKEYYSKHRENLQKKRIGVS